MKSGNVKSAALFGLMALSFALNAGCGDVASMMANATSSDTEVDYQKVMKMFRDADADCPTTVDQWTTLVAVNIVDERNIEFRYEVSDEGRNLVRRIPKEQMRRTAIAAMKRKRMVVAVAEKDLSIQHIYEDRYGSYVLSYTINRQVLDGNLYPTGSEKTNPFAADEKVVKKSVAEQIFATEVGMTREDDVTFPKSGSDVNFPSQIKTSRRGNKDNPHGVHANPYLGS